MARRLVLVLAVVLAPALFVAFRAPGEQRHIVIAGSLEEPRPLLEVAADSDLIAVVRATEDASTRWNSADNVEWQSNDAWIYTDRRLTVESVIKGDAPNPLIVRLVGGTVDRVTMKMSDQPDIVPGARYIVFLKVRDTPTREGSQQAWTLAGYEGVLEELDGRRWRNKISRFETTLDGVRRSVR